MQGEDEDDEESEVLADACMLDLADDLQDSMWVDVPLAGVLLPCLPTQCATTTVAKVLVSHLRHTMDRCLD